MAWSTTTIADVAKYPSGAGIPYGIVYTYPRNPMQDSGQAAAAAHSAVAGANGVFSLAGLEATNTGGGPLLDPGMTDIPFSWSGTGSAVMHYGSHHVTVVDPTTGEHVFDVDCVVPSAGTVGGYSMPPTTLAALAACAI